MHLRFFFAAAAALLAAAGGGAKAAECPMIAVMEASAPFATIALPDPSCEAARLDALRARVDVLSAKLAALTRHDWPALSADEKAALKTVLKTLPKTTKFDIVCNTASCDALAEDIDDAMEAAGLASSLDHSAGPLGYGIGVMVNLFDKPAAETAIAALKRSTGGRLDPPLIVALPGQNPQGTVTILIGKRAAH